MAESAPDEDVRASINDELREHYQRHVDAYRPDLKGDTPPGEPVFHPLNLCYLREEREKDRREFSVSQLLRVRLQQTNVEPRRVLLLGRPESGKTALFGSILHYWLHGKDVMDGLNDFDILLAVQCLGLESNFSDGKTAVDLEKHMLDHLPQSVQKYGEEVVRQTIRKAKVLIMIDSLDCLEENILNLDTSLAPWTDSRVILFCRYKFMKDNCQLFDREQSNDTLIDQSEDNLVLKLWGGMYVKPFYTPNILENISDLGGVLSGKLLQDYCMRLCNCRKINFDKFWKYFLDILKYFSLDMRKPFNIYMAMEAFCNHFDMDAKSLTELYSTWFENCSKLYRTKEVQKSDSDIRDITVQGTSSLSRLAYKAFTSKREYLSHEDIHENSELVPFFIHFLMPHYNSNGGIEKFTFRIAAHKIFLAARHSVTELQLGMTNVKKILDSDNFMELEPLLPMILGVAKGSKYYGEIKAAAIEIAKLNLEEYRTKAFSDPIINYAVTVLNETELFSKTDGQFDPFVRELVDCLGPNNWSIVDGNMYPEALKTLCMCGHDNTEPAKCKPQRVNIILFGTPNDMPGLNDILGAVKYCNMRINFSNDCSFLNEEGNVPLDDVVSAMQGKGKASLASFSGYLKDVGKFDIDPATRRMYKISLRICSHSEYEQLRQLCKNSHKLSQVVLRISHKADINIKKLKDLPANISKLTVLLEDFHDGNVKEAIEIWKSIQGTAQREVRNLRFWVIKNNMTANGVKKIIDADLLGTRIELSLNQPVSDLDQGELQKALNYLKESKYIIRFLGSAQHKRFDMEKQSNE